MGSKNCDGEMRADDWQAWKRILDAAFLDGYSVSTFHLQSLAFRPQ